MPTVSVPVPGDAVPVPGDLRTHVVRSRAHRAIATVVRLAREHPRTVLVVFGVVCALTAWLRLPAIARDTFWAEDGHLFVEAAVNGGAQSLFLPYAGYLHTVPRLVALAVVVLPVPVWALATTAASCLIAGALAVCVFVCTRDVVPWMPARVFIAALTVMAPLGPREVIGDLTNIHSLFLWTLFWMLLARPRTRGGAVALGAIGLLGALTEVQALFLLPLVLLRPHGQERWIVRAGVLAGLAAQLVVTLAWPRAHNGNPPVPGLSIAYGYLINAVMPLGVPQSQIGPVLAATGPAVGLAILAALAVAAGYALRRGLRLQRQAVIAAVAGSLAVYAAGVVMNPDGLYDYASGTPSQLAHVWLVRYGVVPSMLLASLIPIAATVAFRRSTVSQADAVHGRIPSSGRSLPAVCLALAAVLLLAQFGPQLTRRSWGPEWQPQLAHAAEVCSRDTGQRYVSVRETIGWDVTVPCSRLDTDPD